MCCGRPRTIASGPRLDRPGRGAAEFEYIGRTALPVTGPASGQVYRFAAVGVRQRVDRRDAIAFQRVPLLRLVG